MKKVLKNKTPNSEDFLTGGIYILEKILSEQNKAIHNIDKLAWVLWLKGFITGVIITLILSFLIVLIF